MAIKQMTKQMETCTFITVTRNRFSSSSCIAPLIEPIAQHNCNRPPLQHMSTSKKASNAGRTHYLWHTITHINILCQSSHDPFSTLKTMLTKSQEM